MRAADYLDAAKQELNVSSDYALAARMSISRSRLHELRHEQRPVDAAEAIWLAVTLKKDPGQVVAELAEQREKNPKKKALLRSFLSRAAAVAAICCTLGLSFTAGGESAVGGPGGKRRRCYA